jgi:hypothetical protein
MEETKEGTEQPVSKVKKAAKKKPVLNDAQKVAEAKKKVNELLKGTGLEEPESDEVYVKPDEFGSFASIQEEKGSSWMQTQIQLLTKQVEDLEFVNMKLQKERSGGYQGGANAAPAQVEAGSDRQKIVELYKHLEGVYTGRNKYKTPFGKIALSNPQYANGVLDLFLATFPFLQDAKSYRHWGGND